MNFNSGLYAANPNINDGTLTTFITPDAKCEASVTSCLVKEQLASNRLQLFMPGGQPLPGLPDS
jgi:hypothetical protein